MRFILRTIAAAAISLIVKEALTRDNQPPLSDAQKAANAKKVN